MEKSLNSEPLSIVSINELINAKRKSLYGKSYELAIGFIKKLHEFLNTNSLFDRDLDFVYFGIQIEKIENNEIIFNEEALWALSKEDFFDTKNELIEYNHIREEIETFFIRNNKSLYDLEYSECDWGIFFKVLEKEGFMPYLQKMYPRNRNTIKDLKIVVLFKCSF